MIISHKYKFIFLKTTKTAGTSIEISLSRFLGEYDIITPLIAKDEAIREKLNLFPKNYLHTRILNFPEERLENFDKSCFEVTDSHLTTKFYNHMPAIDIKKGIGKEIWDSYFKLCFVRNPWDRIISAYYWDLELKGKYETLEQFIKRSTPDLNVGIYTINNKIAVDYVGKYENLMEDLLTICQKLSIPFDGWLPKAKGNVRQNRKHYSEVLTQKQADFVRERCTTEIEQFGYEFS